MVLEELGVECIHSSVKNIFFSTDDESHGSLNHFKACLPLNLIMIGLYNDCKCALRCINCRH